MYIITMRLSVKIEINHNYDIKSRNCDKNKYDKIMTNSELWDKRNNDIKSRNYEILIHNYEISHNYKCQSYELKLRQKHEYDS